MNLQRGLVLAARALMLASGSQKEIVASLLLVSGCRQIVGIDERHAFEGDASNKVACGLPTQGAACATCMAARCCDESQQCADDPLQQCLPNEECLQRCPVGDSACRLGCSKKWVGGPHAQPESDPQTRLHDCRDRSCSDACAPWDCLGKVGWQVPDVIPPEIVITANARCARCSSVVQTGPNAGVHVSVCSMADPECAVDLSDGGGDTGPDGRVSLTVETHGNPLSVFLNFHKVGWLDDLLLLNTPPLSYDFDVGVVDMDALEDVGYIAANLQTAYNPDLAVVKLNISNCNLGPGTGIDVTWPQDPGGAPAIDTSFDLSEWDAVAVNVPVFDPTPRLVARMKSAGPQDAASAPLVANVNLVVREGAITLAPFVTPTP